MPTCPLSSQTAQPLVSHGWGVDLLDSVHALGLPLGGVRDHPDELCDVLICLVVVSLVDGHLLVEGPGHGGGGDLVGCHHSAVLHKCLHVPPPPWERELPGELRIIEALLSGGLG